MNALPIFKRELQRALRRRLVYWLRLGTVLAGVLIGASLLAKAGTWQAGSAIGREIFERVAWPAFAMVLLSGVFFSSNLLCEERAEGSLALIFLTQVRGLDVILGKLLAIALLTSQVVLGVFPVIALCIVLGGISGAEFVRLAEVLVSTLVLSLSVGIFVSALNKSLGRAALVSFLVLAGGSAILKATDWQAHLQFPGLAGLIVPGPIQLLENIPDLTFRLPPQGFRDALVFQVILAGALCLLGGSMLKRLALGNSVQQSGRARLIDFHGAWRARRRPLRRNPVHWLVQRQRRRSLLTWLLFALLTTLWVTFLNLFGHRQWGDMLGFFVLAPVIHLLFKLVVISEASEFLSNARREELELLLVSPLSSSKIILGHARALLRQFAWPAGALLLTDLFIVFSHQPRAVSNQSTFSYLLLFGLGITLVVDLPALIWRGLWNGLRLRSSLTAVRQTILEVLVVPCSCFLGLSAVVFWFAAVFIQLLQPFGVGEIGTDSGWVVGSIILWWLVSFILGIFLKQNARQNLSTWLRFIASNEGGGARPVQERARTLPPHLLRYAEASAR